MVGMKGGNRRINKNREKFGFRRVEVELNAEKDLRREAMKMGGKM